MIASADGKVLYQSCLEGLLSFASKVKSGCRNAFCAGVDLEGQFREQEKCIWHGTRHG
jgi:hypothetical protein